MTDIADQAWNQVSELADINLYGTDRVMQAAVEQLTGTSDHATLHGHGEFAGAAGNRYLARQANVQAPQHHAWDALGRRTDTVAFHSSWHALMAAGFEHGLHCGGWTGSAHAHVLRAVHFMLHGQLEAGSLCPLTMTHAAFPLLQNDARFAPFVTRMASRQYDARDIFWEQKSGLMVGMGLTEKQGGTDLRLCQTRATAISTPGTPIFSANAGQHYLLKGHKWFFSSPTSDAHLVLAREGTDGPLSCFFVPRWLADGQRNAVRINRLKDKLGNRSNASAEVEFDQALALRVGEADKGIALLMTMAGHTRLDCVLGSSALLRQAVLQAVHYAGKREVMGRLLIEQPLMRVVLANLALESEAATTLALYLAAAFDRSDPQATAWQRVLTPAAKFWVCRRAIAGVAECMESLGGNGYIEDGPMAILYREVPVNSIWEGSGNVMCLDVLRALGRHPEHEQALWASLAPRCEGHPVLQKTLDTLRDFLHLEPSQQQVAARGFARRLVHLVQAGLLRESAPASVVEVFIQTRLAGLSDEDSALCLEKTAATILQRVQPCL